MAALLRHGARRVGGSVVQRTKAASTPRAAAEERRLLTTTEFQHMRPQRPIKDLQDVSWLIQERKEQLYDMISAMEGTTVGNNYRNRQLLRFLSAQVKPRPDDSLWRRIRALERMKDAARATVRVTGLTLAYLVYSWMAEPRPRGKEVTQTAKKQE